MASGRFFDAYCFSQRSTPAAYLPCILRATLVLVLTTACSDGMTESPCDSVYSRDGVSILTWWNIDRENTTAEALAAQFVDGESTTCDGTAQVTLEPCSDKQDCTDKLTGTVSYDLVLRNGGADIERLACADQNLLRVEDYEWPWTDRIPDPLLPGVMPCSDNALYAIPLGVHSLNRLYFNAASLTSEERGELFSLDTETFVNVFLRKIASRQVDKPIVLARHSSASHLLIENLMIGFNKQAYTDFWNYGGGNAEEERTDLEHFRKTIDLAKEFRNYVQFVDNAEEALDYLQADATRTIFYVSGDWLGNEPRLDVIHTAFPGTQGVDVYTTDVLGIPVNSSHAPNRLDAAHAFLKNATSPEFQAQFAQLKNSRPVTVTDRSGNVVKATPEQLFPHGEPVPGLPLMVSHEAFIELDRKAQCFLFSTTDAPTACDDRGDDLFAYVESEYCHRLSHTCSSPQATPMAAR